MKAIVKAKYEGYGSYQRSASVPFETEAYNFIINGVRYHYFHLDQNGNLKAIDGLSTGGDCRKWFDIEATLTESRTMQRVKILSGPVADDKWL